MYGLVRSSHVSSMFVTTLAIEWFNLFNFVLFSCQEQQLALVNLSMEMISLSSTNCHIQMKLDHSKYTNYSKMSILLSSHMANLKTQSIPHLCLLKASCHISLLPSFEQVELSLSNIHLSNMVTCNMILSSKNIGGEKHLHPSRLLQAPSLLTQTPSKTFRVKHM